VLAPKRAVLAVQAIVRADDMLGHCSAPKTELMDSMMLLPKQLVLQRLSTEHARVYRTRK
jgi:hypothetical protein